MPLGHKDHFELKAVFFCLVGFLFCFYLGLFGFFLGGVFFVLLFFILKANLKKQTPKSFLDSTCFLKAGHTLIKLSSAPLSN